MTQRIRTLKYRGGKNGLNHGSGRWVASLLPQDMDVVYCESHCGLCGILFQRPRATNEIINDLNERISNFLRAVRDETDELAHKIHYSPPDERDFAWGVAHLDDEALHDIDRARAFYTVIQWGVMHGDAAAAFSVTWSASKNQYGLTRENVLSMGERLRDVQILNRDGADVIESLADNSDSVIYVDPPYAGTRTEVYRYPSIDADRLGDVLRQCVGRVAVSGYGDEWDSLGWQRHEFKTSTLNMEGTRKYLARTEVLWTNYEPGQRRLL